MTLILSGTNGLSDVDGSAATPAIRGTDTNTGIFFPAADTVGIATGGTERARVDSSGNLGLGVTPSAWGSNARVVQVAGGGSVFGQTNANIVTLGGNMYWDNTNFKYVATDYASKYVQYQSQHLWFTAASGTAGNTITFTQAMTLDASGNLGIVITSPSYPLTRNGVTLQAKGSDGAEFVILSNTDSGYNGFALVRNGSDIGLNNRTNGIMSFSTNNTERARIDSSGRLLVGTTTSLDNGSVFKTGDGATALNAYRATTSASYGGFATYSDIGGTTTVRSYIRSDGGFANYSANNVNLSDENLKKDISLAGNYLAKICAIPVKNFRYKDQSESEDITLGVIAQDVLAVAPELVSQEGFGPSEEKQSYLSVYQTDLQYALMKSIQELKAIVDAQAAEIAALKGNA